MPTVIRGARPGGKSLKAKPAKSIQFSVTRVKKYGHKVDRSLDRFFARMVKS